MGRNLMGRNLMSRDLLIHPPGGLPEGAPRGLVDVWMSTQPSVGEQARAALVDTITTHAFGLVFWTILLLMLIGFGVWFWRDWRGRLLRWQVRRMRRLLQRESTPVPEPVGAALMWALARYFRMRPGVDRRALPREWQVQIGALDTLRFGPAAPIADWLTLLDAMSALTRASCATHPQATSS